MKGDLMRRAYTALAASVITAVVAPTWAQGQVAPSTPPTSNTSIPFREITTGPFAAPTVRPQASMQPVSPQPQTTPAPAVLYVFATGGDATTRQKFIAYLTEKLQTAQTLFKISQPWNTYAQQQVRLVPEPDWAVSDYTTACQSSRDIVQAKPKPPVANDLVAGALIVGITAVSSWINSQYVWKTNFTKLMANLYYSACDTATKSIEGPEAKPTLTTKRIKTSPAGARTVVEKYSYSSPKVVNQPPYYIAWNTDLWEGTGHQGFFTPLPLLSLFMTGVSAWAAFTPSVTKSTTNTTTFPTPMPPIPPSGYVSTSVTTNSKTSNANQFVTVSNAFLGAQANLDTSLPLTVTNDQTTNSAVDFIVNVFLFNEMRCPRALSTAGDPSSRCFAILTRRNNETDPDVMSNYRMSGDDQSTWPLRIFTYNGLTYIQMKPGVTSQLSFLGSQGDKDLPYYIKDGLYVIYGVPERISLTSSTANGLDVIILRRDLSQASARRDAISTTDPPK